MKKTYIFLAFFFSLNLFAADIFVISSPDVNLTKEEIKDVYLGNKQLAGSIKLNIVENKSLQTEFLAKVIGAEKSKYDALWAKKSFQDGISAPKVKGTDADVLEFIKSNTGAVGYVSSPGNAKVITKY